MKIRWDDLRLERAMLNEYKKALDFYLKQKFQGSTQIGQLRESFEKKFAQYLGMKYAVALNSGSDAFSLGLKILGIKRGDSVIIPNVTYATVPLAILGAGAKPILVDISTEDLNIDTNLITSKIKKNTKAIVASHLFGRACNIEKIIQIAKKYKLKIIEDACQSFGSEYKERKIGTFGDISFFSFSYNKPLSSCAGAGGMLCFNNKKYLNIVSSFTKGNFSDKEESRLVRFSPMQLFDLISLDVKFKYLESIFDSRRMLKKTYEKQLEDISQIQVFKDSPEVNSVPGLNFVVLADKRSNLSQYLKQQGIELLDWEYPSSVLNRMRIFKKVSQGKFPISDLYQKKALYLPLFSFMKKAEVEFVVKLIKQFYK